MDGQRFDDLLRGLVRGGAASIPRRRLLGVLAAAAGSIRLGPGSAAAAKPVCSPEGGACKNDRQCCGGTCTKTGKGGGICCTGVLASSATETVCCPSGTSATCCSTVVNPGASGAYCPPGTIVCCPPGSNSCLGVGTAEETCGP